MNRTRLLLILLLLLAGAAWYAWQETPRQQRVAGGTAAKSRGVASAGDSSAEQLASLDFSVPKPEDYRKPKRDLFRPLYRPPVVVAKPAPPPPVVVAKPAPPPPPPPPTKPRPVVQRPVGPKPVPPLQVLGFLQKENGITVFLSSRSGDVYLVKQGDRFADDLLVRELTEEQVVISRTMTDPGLTLTLAGKKNKPVAMPKTAPGRPNVPQLNLNVPKAGFPPGFGQ